MRKITLLLGMLGITVIAAPAFGTTMCVQNDNVAVVLDPSVAGTTYTYDNALGRWDTTFPYGHVIGISACITTSGSYGKAVSQLKDDGNDVVGGEVTGAKCWCKMTHPAVSLWVFARSYGSTSACASDCAYDCGYYVRRNSDFRAGLFGSVAY